MSLLKKRTQNEVTVVEVFCQDDYYHVKPSHGSYEMIYRAGRGVYWDEDRYSLYFKGVTTRENALEIIAEAMENEYYIKLVF